VTVGDKKVPETFSLLEIVTTTQKGGLRLPQLTTAQRDALNASLLAKPAEAKGLVIYNIESGCLEYWNNNKWISICSGGGGADISFTNPGGNPANPGDVVDPSQPFPPEGGSKGPLVPHDNPECTTATANPPYTFMVITGEEYTFINVINPATGEFTITMSANETAKPRTAVVRIVNNCTGEYKEFLFSQSASAVGCGTTSSIPNISSENGNFSLCVGGAVYLYLDGRPTTGTYIWTLGDVEKGRGSSLVATIPGTYKVYADKLGCTSIAPKTVNVTSSASNAPSPVSITINGYASNVTGETQLFASTIGSGTIVWYKNGVKQAGKTGTPISAGIGLWFAVVEDGSCISRPSNTVSVSYDPNGGSVYAAIPSGASGSMSGRTCFDVALSNSNEHGCGPLSARGGTKQANFTLGGTNTQVYSFTPHPGNVVSKVRFAYVENPSGQIVESFTGPDYSNESSITGTCTVTVVYKSSLNNAVRGLTNHNAYKLDIYAIYNDDPFGNGVDQTEKITASIKDCACCGAKISASEWKEFMCYNLGADMSVDPFTPSPALNGDYYQWGFKYPSATRDHILGTPSSGASYSYNTWNATIATDAFYGDNSTGTNVKVKSVTDPCPNGFRVPSRDELAGVFANNTVTPKGTWGHDKSAGKMYGDVLYLPATGYVIPVTAAPQSNYPGNTMARRVEKGLTGNYHNNTKIGRANSVPLGYYNSYVHEYFATQISQGSESTTKSLSYYCNDPGGYSVRCIAQ
jgi:hypothetical protein